MRQPDLRIDIYLVEYGIQTDIIVDGETKAEVCRDFSDEYEVDKLLNELYRKMVTVISDFIRDH